MIDMIKGLLGSFLGRWQAYVAVAVLAGALASYSTFYVTDAVMGRILATERSERATEKLLQVEAARASEEVHRALEQALWQRIADIQSQAEKDANDDREADNRLRADLAAGARSLWILARCPAAAAGGTIADPAAATGCADTPVRLSRAAEETYLQLQAAIRLDRRTITACQADAAAIRATYADLLKRYNERTSVK